MPPFDESAASAPHPPFVSGQDRRTTQPTLHSARLTLVPLAGEHLDLEAELESDAEVMRYLTGRAMSRAEAEQAHQRRIAAAREVPGLGFWVGFDHDNFIGWWILQPPHGPVLARHARNRRLADALDQWASCSLTHSPGARTYYDQLRGRGKTHRQALRQLANR
jgi:hypothetical protein